VRYNADRKAWMMMAIFTQFLRVPGVFIFVPGRNVFLFIVICGKQLLASSCPSLCIEELGFHRADFHEI